MLIIEHMNVSIQLTAPQQSTIDREIEIYGNSFDRSAEEVVKVGVEDETMSRTITSTTKRDWRQTLRQCRKTVSLRSSTATSSSNKKGSGGPVDVGHQEVGEGGPSRGGR